MNSSISISHMKNTKLSIYFRHCGLIYKVSPNPSLCMHTDTLIVHRLYELVSVTWHQSRAEPTNTQPLVATSFFFYCLLNGIWKDWSLDWERMELKLSFFLPLFPPFLCLLLSKDLYSDCNHKWFHSVLRSPCPRNTVATQKSLR